MANYTAGSVSAEIKLDTKQFKQAIEELKGEVKELKTAFDSVKGSDKVSEEVEQLKKDVESLQKTNKSLKDTISQLKKGLEDMGKSSKNTGVNVENLGKIIKQSLHSFEKEKKEITSLKKALDELNRTQINPRNLKYSGKSYSNNWEVTVSQIKEASSWFNKWDKEVTETSNYNRKFFEELKRGGIGSAEIIGKAFLAMGDGAEKYKQRIARISEELKAKWHSMTVDLAKASAAQYKYWKQIRGTADVEGYNQLTPLKFSGYNSYLSDISNITAAVEKLDFSKIHMAEFKEELIRLAEALKTTSAEFNRFGTESDKIITSMSRFAKVNEATAEITKLQQSISHFSSLSNTNSKALSKFGERAKILKDSLRVLETEFMEGKMAEEVYAAETERVAAQIQKLKAEVVSLIRELSLENVAIGKNGEVLSKSSAEYKKLEGNARQAGRGIITFNNGVVQTAHSGRILSNTLYQIRGALLSLKMIATAMGGMMVWDFAMQIAEGIKTTFTAKNELESQLKQNVKVGASGLDTFNRALDKTIKKFQKVNKYQLGETVSSLGVEFELTSKQMEKAMPVVAMIQSEYIRAGRTSEEAALAVKDILQGEFQRLSRETGVGKEELLAYGWNGDKTDIESLLDAVKKAGEDRNWDIFAAKATSLNDVIEITKNRFEEFGADLLQTISPAIVSGFNTILDTITGLQKAFNGLGSFGKNAVVAGAFIGGIGAIGTLLPMVSKGMGLAEIATIGWGKSLATAALNLNKAEVAQHGFRKALAAVISGTTAADLAETRWTKAIMGRILGVNQGTLAQEGYLAALVKNRMEMTTIGPIMSDASIASLKWYQKLGYLSGGLKESEVATAGLRKSLLNTATAFKVLKAAMFGIGAIALISAYTSLATWADTTRKNISALNEVIDNGDDMVKDAESDVAKYTKQLSELTEGTKAYTKAQNNLKVAEANERDIKNANKLSKAYKEQNEEREKQIQNSHKAQMARTYELAGLDGTEAEERASGWKRKVIDGNNALIQAETAYEHRLYQSNQHINERLNMMTEEERKSKETLKYIDEYSVKAEEVANNIKKFKEGDLTAGVYAVIGEIQLMWIDLWNDKHFVNFWNSVKKTWHDLKPTLDEIKQTLGDVGHMLLDFFSTDGGKIVGGIAIAGLAFGTLGLKLYHVLGGTKSTWDILKKLGGTLKDRITDWKDLGDKAEEANEKMGGDKSTGGIKGEGKGPSLGAELKGIGKTRLKSFVNNALLIAEGMALVTEAIYLLQAPMWALAETGKMFKAKEKSIQAGIDGLKLVAPTVIAILIPIMALMKIMDMWGGKIMNIKTIVATAAGIAVGIALVAEAIIMLKAPMWALAQIGNDFKSNLIDIKNGVTAMNYMGNSLKYLAPFIPAFVAGIALMAGVIAAPEVGLIALGGVVAGIALAMVLVAEAVVTLRIPLEAIRELGNSVGKLDGVEKGAEALKVTAEAMGYVSSALGELVKVQWEMLASNVAELLGVDMGTALEDLVKDEDGFLPKLSKFAEKFNAMEFTPVEEDKATSLKTVADSLGSINTALDSAKKAIDNLPSEFKNGGNGQPLLSYDMENGSTAVTGSANGEDVSSYFDQLKQPLEELGKFIDWFNNTLQFPEDGIDTGKLDTISQSADMVTRVNDAVSKVKETMGNIGIGNIATTFAQMTGGTGGGSIIPGVGTLMNVVQGAFGGGGQGDYKSSIGSQLYEMQMVLEDLATFNSKISTIGGGSSGDGGSGGSSNVEALSGMVTAVSDAISKLETTLSAAVPTIKQSANDIGTGIRDGIKTGVGDLTQIVVPPLVNAMNAMKANAYTYGKGVGERGRTGFKETFKITDTVNTELNSALSAMEDKKQEFHDKGYALGDAAAQGFKEGDDMHSPGIIARTIFEELDYVSGALDTAITTMPNQTYALAETMANNFNPSLDIGGISVDELSQFQTGLNSVSSMANTTDMQTSTAFQNMNLNVGTSMTGMAGSVNTAFTNIKQNATTSYAQLTNTTKVSLKNMQDQTVRNINNIKTSWRGMQTALIASAENIRSQTGQKIQQLESNMASFWRKVQNPANLLGAAGSSSMVQHTKPQRRSGRMAAGPSSTKLPRVRSKIDSSYIDFKEYLKCLMEDGVCMAGGWHFNWSPDIQRAFMRWNTHFNKYNLDAYLKVGKFEHDDFPVRGIASVAKDYIFDAISQTSYAHYYNHRYGSALEAYNAGSFNCVDGAMVAIGLADAFGFGGGSIQYGTWDGEGHGFAVIPGLGVIDATAIQQRGRFTAPGTVKGYPAAGSRTINSGTSKSPQMGNTVKGDVVFNITVDGKVDNPDELGEQIGKTASETFIDMFRRSNATGR